jgi:superfamily II DNA or RNA helicase
MLVLPTGAGKTAIAGFYIGEELVHRRHDRVLVLQHTDELIDQNRNAIGTVTGLATSVVKAEQDDWGGRIVFGSVQTLARANRRQRMAPVSHLVIDECHRSAAQSYQAVIDEAQALIRTSCCSGFPPRRVAVTDEACAAPSAMSAII